jgi:hypothetical protein
MVRGWPPVRADRVRFAFAGYGERAPEVLEDRLFLDVGGDLRPGVLDHHQLDSTSSGRSRSRLAGGSTARLVLNHPDLVAGAVAPAHAENDPFTVVLHERPDLDSVAASFLAIAYLTNGQFPPGAAGLADYVDRVDAGSLGLTLANPFSLYSAHIRLAGRPRPASADPAAGWEACVRAGLEVVDFVLTRARQGGAAVGDVDAFACPVHFGDEDREAVRGDVRNYEAKLADPRTRARVFRLRLPGHEGGEVDADALLVRDVQNEDDPAACLFFKDWARSDAGRCPNGWGFAALSVFHSEGPRQKRRCILSVTPDSGASLRGLGATLDAAEGRRRRELYGADDRVTDPTSGAPLLPRPGYANADPWYDGRGHDYTIVDSPRSGTRLSADEIEEVFLQLGGART